MIEALRLLRRFGPRRFLWAVRAAHYERRENHHYEKFKSYRARKDRAVKKAGGAA